ncbi:amino acid adenylation domain-containing protein [Streptomyces rhizosphaericus]|uniref:Amino acid adenylation domain-containing protein n=1 Tax=Streptomyces rhizosphaericus TaxID=114699 RepID=A0A6G4A963_9ACTN|nr:amino acid adenylation domain-containing protein [Streptomyces rhizosphaericus]NEW69760.1 amino acid adenylation domain-containing protein [Streptomyces rhizosphaericus]
MTRLEGLVSAQATRTPEADAVVFGPTRLTYRELDERSSQLAHALRTGGLRPDDRVCVLVPKGPDAVVYLLGVLKAGGVCVPLDTGSPADRLVSIVNQTGPCRLLADRRRTPLATEVSDAVAPGAVVGLCLPEGDATGPLPTVTAADVASAPTTAPEPVGGASGVAYVLFTSGSAGEPKGVPLTHAAIIHFVTWANEHFGLRSDDRISCHLQLHFDGSLWDVYGPLVCGAELHLVPPEASLLPTTLAQFIRDARLTQWLSVPSVLSAMARHEVVEKDDFPQLRRVLWGGEVFPPTDVEYWMRRLPHVTFTGFYGTTETTIASSYYTLTELPDEALPVGRAIPGEWLEPVDDQLRPVAPGEVGEMVIGGAGVSPGYWRDPERTAASFIELPPGSGRRAYRTGDLGSRDADGLLRFHGRADRQVKVNGYRVELDEVMTELHSLPEIAAAAVVAAPSRTGSPLICAAYALTAGVSLTTAQVKARLGSKVPGYMLPTRWLALESLPVNANGKTDLRALQQRFAADEAVPGGGGGA